MNMKINFYEIVSLVVVAVYFKTAALPYEIWETVNMSSREAAIITILDYFIIMWILVPLFILYNGLKPNDA